MGYLKIDGYEPPSPKRGIEPIITTVVNEGRNANGVLVGQRIGRDLYKLNNLEWPWLSAKQWSELLSHLNKFVFDVTFHDPVRNKFITIKMYCGDRTAEPYYFGKDGNPTYYRNCRVNLIDTGESIIH